MTTYSDYPFPDHFPNYLHNSRIMDYLWMYVQHFDLTKHIRFLVSEAGNPPRAQEPLAGVKGQARVRGGKSHPFRPGGQLYEHLR